MTIFLLNQLFANAEFWRINYASLFFGKKKAEIKKKIINS